jgi:thiamine-monophosphate kinase
LEHILQASGAGAELSSLALPLSADFRTHLERQPALLDLALGGGEDYELLCTVPPQRVAEALALAAGVGVPLTVIGAVTEQSRGLCLRSGSSDVRPLRVSGYDHFCRSAEESSG